MTTPANLPFKVGVPAGAPTDILSIGNFLVQFSQAVNAWVASAANALNWLLGQTTQRAHTSHFANPNLGFSTTSTTAVSTGFTTLIKPKYSGTILCLAQCEVDPTTAGAAQFVNIWYGTGTAPAANAAMTGTVLNPTPNTPSLGVDIDVTVPIVGAAFALTVGTSYWFTLGTFVTAGTGLVNHVAVTLVEI